MFAFRGGIQRFAKTEAGPTGIRHLWKMMTDVGTNDADIGIANIFGIEYHVHAADRALAESPTLNLQPVTKQQQLIDVKSYGCILRAWRVGSRIRRRRFC